jgi:hypothetical protein|tara:strand:+ start:453 stop:617 length:165 start_codon:yes stop_codon:yes gene_type:complete
VKPQADAVAAPATVSGEFIFQHLPLGYIAWEGEGLSMELQARKPAVMSSIREAG